MKKTLIQTFVLILACLPGSETVLISPAEASPLAALAPADQDDQRPIPGRLAVHPDRISVEAVDGTFNTLVVLLDERVLREFHAPALRGIGVVEARRDEFRGLIARSKALNRKVLVNIGHSTTMYRDSSGDILEYSDIPIVPYAVIEEELERLNREVERLRQAQ